MTRLGIVSRCGLSFAIRPQYDRTQRNLCGRLVAAILLMLSLPVSAFDGTEHKVLGDVALVIALKVVENEALSKGKDPIDFVQELKPAYLLVPCKFRNFFLSPSEGPRQILRQELKALFSPVTCDPSEEMRLRTYGDIVKSVDYMLAPGQLFTRRGVIGDTPKSREELDDYTILEITSVFSLARASKNNAAHFQGQLMSSMRDSHARAAWTAHYHRNLYSDLLINAYADHYLQDIFAPGHVLTIRDNLDLFALDRHDTFNEAGWDFVLRTKEAAPLRVPLTLLRDHSVELKRVIGKHLAFSTKGIGHVLDQIPDYDGVSAGAPIGCIRIQGDGALRKGGESELLASEAQSAFLIAVTAQSILDVLRNYLFGEENNFLEWYKWDDGIQSQNEGTYKTSPVAELPFGYYAIAIAGDQPNPRKISGDEDPPRSFCHLYPKKQADLADQEGPTDRNGQPFKRTAVKEKLDLFAAVYNISATQEAAVTKGSFTHRSYTIEQLTGGPARAYDRSTSRDSIWDVLGVGLGFSMFEEEAGFKGYGFPLRIAMGFRSLPDLQLSYIWRHSRVSLNEAKSSTNGNFLRLDLVNGPVSVYVGVGTDHLPTDSGSDTLTKKSVVIGGIQFTFWPWSFRGDSNFKY